MYRHKIIPQDFHKKFARIDELESTRGIAALFIVMFHLPKWNPILDCRFINNGYLMVDLFFVLSGFVIFNAYSDGIHAWKDVFRFQFLRLARLYPVHLMFLFIFLAIEFLKYLTQAGLGINSPNSTPFDQNNLSEFLKNLFLVSAIFPNNPLTFNFPAWSISVEFYTYLIFAVGTLLMPRQKSVFFALISFTSLILLSAESTFGFGSLLQCLAGFFIGCLTAEFSKTYQISLPAHTSSITILVFACFIGLDFPNGLRIAIYPLSAVLVLTVSLANDGLVKKILKLNFLRWLGAISYSVYMSHAAVLWVINQFIRVILKKPEIVTEGGKSIPQLSGVGTAIATTIALFVVLAISSMTYTFIEKPIRERGRRYAFAKMV